jgi:Phospholipase_D-nuclease N-terminal
MEAETIIIGALLTACLALYISAVISIHKRKFRTYREKGMWLAIVIAMPVIGSLIYFFACPKNLPGFTVRLFIFLTSCTLTFIRLNLLQTIIH